MFTKYILCILTIEWAVLGTWLLKGKGRSYERIQRNDEIPGKRPLCPLPGNESPVPCPDFFPRPAHDIRRFRPSHTPFFRRHLPVSVRPAPLRKLEIRREDLDPVVK